jgi:hypothetical protein
MEHETIHFFFQSLCIVINSIDENIRLTYIVGFLRFNELDFPSVLDARLSFAASSWAPGQKSS